MIAFSCSRCGLKLKVKEEFAGRQSSCPTCKQRLVVPTPARTETAVPADRIDGLLSSLAGAGIVASVTLGEGGPATSKRRGEQKSVRELLERHAKSGERYLLEGEIARGGMGAVLRAVDCDIRREVAVKYLLDQTDARRKARFVEEAQITGQLEHPNIVPIHELGIDGQKRLFFSMKMVKGRSLAQVLDALRQDPRNAEREFSLARLLSVLMNVCHALAYAHSRGVIHRDLKPANIMLGDFGEVYVMDWGLAKVLGTDNTFSSATAPPTDPSSIRTGPSSKIVTNRDMDADLTQDGEVLGTPVYMPPEQALGRTAEIGPRGDVYSLGAILYEMLTLLTPVDKEGGYLSVLMRVGQGEIIPPETRAPLRTKAGKVPKELAAVAMKALAFDPANRYPSAEALRQDIERFLEGRSVSAKSDTAREMAWKMVRRNKAVSAASFVFLVLLAVAFGFTFKNYLAKEARTRQAVPAFVRAANLSIKEGKLDDAFDQVKVALDFDPKNAEAHLLKGQLLIVLRRDYPTAQEELETYLKAKPNDAEARKLVELCRQAVNNDRTLIAFADAFQDQQAYTLTDGMMRQFGKNAPEYRKQLMALYQKRIDKAWPGMSKGLQITPDGNFTLNIAEQAELTDLSPLQGMALTELSLAGCGQVRDLTPLKGMKLVKLDLNRCGQLRDLSPLRGLPLTWLSLAQCGQVHDLSPLKGMPLTWLDLNVCGQVHDLSPLKGMPLHDLGVGRCPKLSDLSPLRGLKLNSLNLYQCVEVADLTPLEGMPLHSLILSLDVKLHDLSPLKGMKLTYLDLFNCENVRDLSPLRGMRLETVNLTGTSVEDLSVLRGMPITNLSIGGRDRRKEIPLIQSFALTKLDISNSKIADLTPLKSMKLTQLNISGCPVKDLLPLQGMKITYLVIRFCPALSDLSPLRGMNFGVLDLAGCGVTDLTPLAGVNMISIVLPPRVAKGTSLLRQVKNLKYINYLLVADFWKRYDKGEFKQYQP